MTSFTEAAHPRTSSGRFAVKPKPEPALSLQPTTPDYGRIQQRRLDAARTVPEDYAGLEIMNHSRTPGDVVQLGSLGDAETARGNCWAASNEIIEMVGPFGFEAEELDDVTLRNRRARNYHVALLVRDQDGEYIADYTARQFDPGLPFPFVASYPEWKASIEAATGHIWDQERN